MDEWINDINRAIRNVNLYDILQIVLMEYEPQIILLNQKQLDKGLKSDGTFTSPYSTIHSKLRKKLGLQTNVKDFKIFNDFRGNMFTTPYGRYKTEFNSSDNKTEAIIAQETKKGGNGDLIFGLTNESIDELLSVDFVNRFRELWFQKLEAA
jgi:hypothetical protein